MFPLKSTGIRDCNKTPCTSFASKNDALKGSRTFDDILLSLLSFTPISSVCCETQNKHTILMIKGLKHTPISPYAICEFAFTLLI